MSGKPHKFHLKGNAVPFAAHTSIPIPHHWKDEVKRQLEKDIEIEEHQLRNRVNGV